MAIVDISQSVPNPGPSKMIQIAPITGHQESNSAEHNIAMGVSSGKAKKVQSPVTTSKRRLSTETHVQSKRQNVGNDTIVLNPDISKQFGINSTEITLTRVDSSMSPKSLNGNVDKTPKKSATSNFTHSSEISITKLPQPHKEVIKDTDNFSPTNDFSSEIQHEEVPDFWSRRSIGGSRLCEASNFLHNEIKSHPAVKHNSYNYDEVITNPHLLPDDENWEEEEQHPPKPIFCAYHETPRLGDENWDSYDLTGNNHVIQDHSNYSPDSAYGSMGDSEMSHFLIGFPNPPGENRCWLNATLHTLFATLFTLPIADDMHQLLQQDKCSKITSLLGNLHELWRKGGSEKTRIYNIIKKFKESLSTLEQTYCSDRQQDVSEFFMALLNHLKTEFDKLLITKDPKTEDHEITTESSPKRSPTAKFCLRNSPFRAVFFETTVSAVEESTVSNSSQRLNNSDEKEKDTSVDESEKSNVTDDSTECTKKTIENPIDKYFLQKMFENYSCKKCENERQIPIENMMVYADIPPENDVHSVDLVDAIRKTFAEEERNLTCEHCKHETHNMKTFYKEFPKVLTIQINRYGMANDGTMNKICTAVSIPEKLSLNNFFKEPSDVSKVYEPMCIISHVGSNMDCGHYTSYVKHEDQWFHYNDMSVMPMTSKEALTAAQSTAYLLFYVDSDLLDKPTSDCYS